MPVHDTLSAVHRSTQVAPCTCAHGPVAMATHERVMCIAHMCRISAQLRRHPWWDHWPARLTTPHRAGRRPLAALCCNALPPHCQLSWRGPWKTAHRAARRPLAALRGGALRPFSTMRRPIASPCPHRGVQRTVRWSHRQLPAARLHLPSPPASQGSTSTRGSPSTGPPQGGRRRAGRLRGKSNGFSFDW